MMHLGGGGKTWNMRRGFSRTRAVIAGAVIAGVGILALGWAVGGTLFGLPRAVNYPPGFDILPGGKQVIFNGAGEGGSDLYLLDLESLQVTSLGSTPEYEADPAVGPQGELVFTGVERGGVQRTRIYLRTKEGRARPITSPGNGTDYGARFMPDGKSLVFVRAHYLNLFGLGPVWLENDLYRVGLNGDRLTRLTREKYPRVCGVSVAPDGRSVVYSASGAYPDTAPHLFQLDLERSGRPKQCTEGAWDTDPDFAPGGRTLAFVSDFSADYSYDLHEYALDTGAIRRVSEPHKGPSSSPRYTPDGRHLLVLSQPTIDGFELWRVELTGGGFQRLADENLFKRPLQWKGTPSPKR